MAIRGSIVLVMLVVAGIVAVPRISGQCGGNFTAIFEECGRFIQEEGPKIPPSPECCTQLEKTDINCTCDYIASRPPGIDQRNNISLDKAIYVTRACGMSIQPGTQCGSYTVPPESSPVPEE